jgi:hypothetical protein
VTDHDQILRMPVYGPGSSFSELLKAHDEDLLPKADPKGPIEVPHGTTVLAIRFTDGVIAPRKGSRSPTGR